MEYTDIRGKPLLQYIIIWGKPFCYHCLDYLFIN